MKTVYVLKCDTDGTMRSIPEPFGVALITPFEKSHWSLADGMNRKA